MLNNLDNSFDDGLTFNPFQLRIDEQAEILNLLDRLANAEIISSDPGDEVEPIILEQ